MTNQYLVRNYKYVCYLKAINIYLLLLGQLEQPFAYNQASLDFITLFSN